MFNVLVVEPLLYTEMHEYLAKGVKQLRKEDLVCHHSLEVREKDFHRLWDVQVWVVCIHSWYGWSLHGGYPCQS